MTMDIRLPQPKSAARILKAALADKGLAATHGQCLEFVAKIYGYQSWHAMQEAGELSDALALTATDSGDFEMSDKPGTSCWIGVGSLSVYVRVGREGEGVAVDLLPKGDEMADPLDEAYATFAQASVDPNALDPSKPFWNSRLPEEPTQLEFTDPGQPGTPVRCKVLYSLGIMLTWLEEGMENHDFDLSEEVFSYRDAAGKVRHVTGQDLVDASLTADGRFTLGAGRSFCIIDKDGQTWRPAPRR